MEKIDNSLYKMENDIIKETKIFLGCRGISVGSVVENSIRNAIRETYFKTKDKYSKSVKVQLPLF